MSRYKLSNMGRQTSESDKSKLVRALKKVLGIREVKVVAGRGEFSIDYSGIEPNINVLREACLSVGFQMDRKM